MRVLSSIRWVLVVAFITALIAPTAWTLVTQQNLVVVDGKSMTPTYKLGDIILVGHATKQDFKPGHVITVRNDAGELYTHRVVTVKDGHAQLKGDGNPFADPDTVQFSSVVGAVRHHIAAPAAPAIALISTWPARISILVLTLGLMFAPLNKTTDSDDSNEERDADDETSAEPAHDDSRWTLNDEDDPFAGITPPTSTDRVAGDLPAQLRGRRAQPQYRRGSST